MFLDIKYAIQCGMSEQTRLHKFLSQAGVASRRKAEELIRQGVVTVNGSVAAIGTKIDPAKDAVKVSGKRVQWRKTGRKIFLVNKPQKVICSALDPEGRETIFKLTGLSPQSFFSVGRLDFQSEGALLMTNDGELCHALTHPKFGVPKVYRVKVKGNCTPKKIKKLADGVTLADGKTAPAKAEMIKTTEQGGWIRLTIHEGKNRQVRRMVEKVGLRVSRLKRESFAGISVHGLIPGQIRPLSSLELRHLKRYH
ncbi:pseudouridine synthase [Bdellovibrionota bacterium]